MPADEKTQMPRKPSAPAKSRRALFNPVAVAVFLLVAIGGTAADLATKDWAFSSILSDPQVSEAVVLVQRNTTEPLGPDQMLHVLAHPGNFPQRRLAPAQRELVGPLKITLSTNAGVVFGMPMPRIATIATTLVTVVLVIVFFALSDARAWPIHLAMALILAGALGNLYDRALAQVVLPGYNGPPIQYQVRDFIDASGLGFWPWIFNVADIFLVVGVAIPMIYMTFFSHREKSKR